MTFLTAKLEQGLHSDRPSTLLGKLLFRALSAFRARKAKRAQDLANITWKAAHARYMSAVDRGDDRGAGEAWGALYRAQTERLRMELGR